MGEHFEKMNKEIEDRAEEYGMLGNSYWIGQERDSCNDVMTIMYFKDSE
jgi:hypothetical protein